MSSMKDKTCLITGATSGIGKEVAFALAERGANLIIVCRDATKGNNLLAEINNIAGIGTTDLLCADLSSQTDIRAMANTIYARYSSLDIVINNAGLVLSNRTLSVDNIEMTLATNHLAPFLLNYLLLDLLRKTHAARIINISSAIHQWGKIDFDDLQFARRKYSAMKSYAQSKLLMNIASFELARRLANTKVTVNCLHPGAVKTNLGSNNAHNTWLKLMDSFIKYFFITPKAAAQAAVYLASSAAVANITGQYFIKGRQASAKALCYDLELGKKVWQQSARLCNINDISL